MKTIKLLSVLLFSASMLMGTAFSAEEKKPCCEATVEAGKKCTHKCCSAAAEKGKICKSCHKTEAAPKK